MKDKLTFCNIEIFNYFYQMNFETSIMECIQHFDSKSYFKLPFRQLRQCKIKYQVCKRVLAFLLMGLVIDHFIAFSSNVNHAHNITCLILLSWAALRAQKDYITTEWTANYKLQNINKTQTHLFLHTVICEPELCKYDLH